MSKRVLLRVRSDVWHCITQSDVNIIVNLCLCTLLSIVFRPCIWLLRMTFYGTILPYVWKSRQSVRCNLSSFAQLMNCVALSPILIWQHGIHEQLRIWHYTFFRFRHCNFTNVIVIRLVFTFLRHFTRLSHEDSSSSHVNRQKSQMHAVYCTQSLSVVHTHLKVESMCVIHYGKNHFTLMLNNGSSMQSHKL